jgi:CRISPR/Cas system-associated endoribonuclease Cas2
MALAIAGAGIAVAGAAGRAGAEDPNWNKDHPRRSQVNHRLQNQDRRIQQDVNKGELTPGQAANLHHEDQQIRQEERNMAAQNGGHITKGEKKVLNQQENAVNKQIQRDASHPNHPRRAEVNHRLADQNHRIDQEVKEGELTPGQAANLHHEDQQIRQEEHDMASQNGGHLTPVEQKVLNQQENAVSQQIGH